MQLAGGLAHGLLPVRNGAGVVHALLAPEAADLLEHGPSLRTWPQLPAVSPDQPGTHSAQENEVLGDVFFCRFSILLRRCTFHPVCSHTMTQDAMQMTQPTEWWQTAGNVWASALAEAYRLRRVSGLHMKGLALSASLEPHLFVGPYQA